MLLGFQATMVTCVAIAVNMLGPSSQFLPAEHRHGLLRLCRLATRTLRCGPGLTNLTKRTSNDNRVKIFGLQEGWTQFVSLMLYMVVSAEFPFEALCAVSACSLGSALFVSLVGQTIRGVNDLDF